MVARLSVLQLFPAFAVAAARNDPPLSSERAWAPPNLPNYERELGGSETGSRVMINPRKVYNLAELIDIAERNNPERGSGALSLGRRSDIGVSLAFDITRRPAKGAPMLSVINPTALPALRIAGAFFLVINLIGIVYIFRNRHRFFGRDPNVTEDIPAVRKLRVEVILIPWFFLTTLLVILLIYLWMQ